MHIIGHRGARAIAPENTKKALLIGMKCASPVEVDVRMTADNIPVIMHDPTLDRTTDGHGTVNEHTLDTLKCLDAGDGEEIPTLVEVLALVEGRSGLVLEIKETGSEGIICRMVEESGVEKVLIVSFNPESIKAAKALLPSVPTCFIYSHEIQNPIKTALASDARTILPRFNLVRGELVRQAKVHELKVVPWTLNTEADIRTAVGFDVDGFATDDPCLAERVLKRIV